MPKSGNLKKSEPVVKLLVPTNQPTVVRLPRRRPGGNIYLASDFSSVWPSALSIFGILEINDLYRAMPQQISVPSFTCAACSRAAASRRDDGFQEEGA